MGAVFQNFGLTSPVESKIFILSLALALLYSFIFSCVRIYFMNDSEMRDKKKRVEFLTTMVMISPTIALIMILIGQDVATAFALLGLMSIIRLRNPSKGVGDIIYYLVAITLGMTCGEQYFLIGAIFCVFISVLLLLTRLYSSLMLSSGVDEVQMEPSKAKEDSDFKSESKEEKKSKKKNKKSKKKDKSAEGKDDEENALPESEE